MKNTDIPKSQPALGDLVFAGKILEEAAGHRAGRVQEVEVGARGQKYTTALCTVG